jgi:hypothetical protein
MAQSAAGLEREPVRLVADREPDPVQAIIATFGSCVSAEPASAPPGSTCSRSSGSPDGQDLRKVPRADHAHDAQRHPAGGRLPARMSMRSAPIPEEAPVAMTLAPARSRMSIRAFSLIRPATTNQAGQPGPDNQTGPWAGLAAGEA